MPRTIADLGPHVAARYPYPSRFETVNGWRMHYVDAGPADAPPVLLLHGNPTWGYLWRDAMPPLLEAGFRVIVPDQIGLGLSEHPHLAAAHSLENHAANLVALVDRLELGGMLVVCHDWGGPTGLGMVLTRPDRVSALAIMSTWAWRSPSAAFHRRISPWRVMHAPLVGPSVLGRHGGMPGRGIHLSVVDRDRYGREGRAAYEAVVPDPDDRRLTWLWPRAIPIGEPTDTTGAYFEWLEAAVRPLRLPTTLIWGREDDVFAIDPFLDTWQRWWPHAEGPHLVTGRHFLQEDSGAEIGATLAEFAGRVLSPGRGDGGRGDGGRR